LLRYSESEFIDWTNINNLLAESILESR
jgi:hypothetical protein